MEEPQNKRNIAYILIGLGAFLLLGQIGLGLNWWAILLIIPGLVMLRNVTTVYKKQRQLADNELIQGGIGLFLTAFGLGFFLDLDFGFMWNLWPLALIAIGLFMIFGRRESV
ncbi:hypothetical protein ACFLYO_10305 [Chloroflexota bacterium]